METNNIENVKAHLNYSVKETIEILNISRTKLSALRNKNAIRYYLKKQGGGVRIKGSEIIKYYNS